MANTYKDAGVDIDAGNELVQRIKPYTKATQRPEVLSSLGGFAALFELNKNQYKEPVLVSATDGVGTKLRLAIEQNKHDTVGIDLVAMCVNDLIVCGAEPLFFLDYFATGKLNVTQAATVIAGIAQGCQQAGCALVGGETAEMPGMYQTNDYDLAGFCVGVVEKNNIIDNKKVSHGDVILGLASSGFHSNGYSLIRHVIAGKNISEELKQQLLQPTRIYVQSILQLLKQTPVHAMAHITGGGFAENIVRVLPTATKAIIQTQSWQRPDIFSWVQQQGQIAENEMLRTFNCGIGYVLIVPAVTANQAKTILTALGEKVFDIGEIHSQPESQPTVVLQ